MREIKSCFKLVSVSIMAILASVIHIHSIDAILRYWNLFEKNFDSE